MAAGFLGRFFRLSRNLINFGFGGVNGGPAPPAPVKISGCITTSIEPTAIVAIAIESTATVGLAFEPTATITITFEGC